MKIQINNIDRYVSKDGLKDVCKTVHYTMIVSKTVGKYEDVVTYDVSAAGETNLVFTPTNDSVNIYSLGSTIEFVCENDGKWYVNVGKWSPDAGVTNGAATGTMLFAS